MTTGECPVDTAAWKKIVVKIPASTQTEPLPGSNHLKLSDLPQ